MTTRRVVTGTNAEGKSYFVHDGPTPGTPNRGGPVVINEIWIDNPADPDPAASRDPVDPVTPMTPISSTVTLPRTARRYAS